MIMWHKVLFVVFNIFIIIKLSISAAPRARVGDDCTEWSGPNGEIGDNSVCTVVTDCEPAVNAIQKRGYHPFRRCGWIGDLEVVCCPRTSSRFGTSERKADKECKKIIKSSIGPINVNIIEGVAASLGEFPHMVALGYEKGDEYDFRCGGTLISKSYVLTAAHCIYREPAIIVRVGVVELGGNSWNDQTDYEIAQGIIHPEYFRPLKYNDIALLRLERPVRTSTVVNPACLYTNDADPDAELIVTGWGKTSIRKNIKSNVLLKASVLAVKQDRCTPHYKTWANLPRGIIAEQICAADPDRRRRSDACDGDSGGPLQMTILGEPQYRVAGVVSFGLGCSTDAPGVYTRVSRYLDWIERIVWPN